MVMTLMADARDVMRGFQSASTYRLYGAHTAQNKGSMMEKQVGTQQEKKERMFLSLVLSDTHDLN